MAPFAWAALPWYCVPTAVACRLSFAFFGVPPCLAPCVHTPSSVHSRVLTLALHAVQQHIGLEWYQSLTMGRSSCFHLVAVVLPLVSSLQMGWRCLGE